MTKEQILVVANVLSFIGNALFTSSSLFKSKKKIIALQTSNHLLSSIAQFMQSAYSGMLQDSVLLVKNIVLLFVEESKKALKLAINVLCILAGLIGGIFVFLFFPDTILIEKGVRWIGLLPVLSIFQYSICSTLVFAKEGLSQNKIEVILKLSLMVNGVLWAVYGIMVELYPITIFNSLTFVISLLSIIRIFISVQKAKKVNDDGAKEEL